MPMPRKPDPEKYCASCGKRMARRREKDGDLESLFHFRKRKYCNQFCMGMGFKGRYRTEMPNWSTSHYRARTIVPLGPCSQCGSEKNVDRHHINGNWRDNRKPNIQLLCRSCHLYAHGKHKAQTGRATPPLATP